MKTITDGFGDQPASEDFYDDIAGLTASGMNLPTEDVIGLKVVEPGGECQCPICTEMREKMRENKAIGELLYELGDVGGLHVISYGHATSDSAIREMLAVIDKHGFVLKRKP